MNDKPYGLYEKHIKRSQDFLCALLAIIVQSPVLLITATWVGVRSTISNNVNICSEVTIGAGPVVINDLNMKDVYIGVLAKKMSKTRLTDGYKSNVTIFVKSVIETSVVAQRLRRAA
ncbi:MAG: hypothetical protein ILN61_08000 [Lachnospiraceae bacterium]|nr:hypothetical protein [Lachnospiraceae bacterium]